MSLVVAVVVSSRYLRRDPMFVELDTVEVSSEYLASGIEECKWESGMNTLRDLRRKGSRVRFVKLKRGGVWFEG
jgi:hypothetical protein